METLGLRKAEVCVSKPDLNHEPGNRLHGPLAPSCVSLDTDKIPVTCLTEYPEREEQSREADTSDADEKKKFHNHCSQSPECG